jgi:hypothetical protein
MTEPARTRGERPAGGGLATVETPPEQWIREALGPARG